MRSPKITKKFSLAPATCGWKTCAEKLQVDVDELCDSVGRLGIGCCGVMPGHELNFKWMAEGKARHKQVSRLGHEWNV